MYMIDNYIKIPFSDSHCLLFTLRPSSKLYKRQIIFEPHLAGMMQAGMMQAGMIQAGMIQAGMMQAGMMQAGMMQAGFLGFRGPLHGYPT